MTNNYNLRGRSLTGLRRWWLMLTGLVLLTVLGARSISNAQSVTNYAFSASSGTFTSIAGSGGSTNIPAIQADFGTSGFFPIGFNFLYNGVYYSQFYAHSDGYIGLGSVANGTGANGLSGGATTGRPILAAYWDDLSGTGGTPAGVATYATTGSVGNRILTVEFLNWRVNWSGPVATSFQVKLYEATGAVQFVYRNEGGVPNLPSASIGITAAGTGAGNFLSLSDAGAAPTVSSVTEAAAISTVPATGQTYTFTPPAAPPAPTSLSFSAVSINSMTLNWADATGEVAYFVERSLDGVNYTTVATLPANAVTYVATGLSAGTTYYWNVRSIGEGQVSSALNGNQTTSAGTICGTYSVGPTGTYATLTAALNDIRTNGLSCSAILELQAAYTSGGETFPIWTGGLGAIAGKTVTIRPETGAVGLSITSANTWTTVLDSLTEYVTIDGRPGGVAGASQLTIQNTANTGSAMRLVQESSNNTFQSIIFRGQNNTTTGAVVFMGGSTVVGGFGNDNNLFDDCDIRDNGTLFPVNGFLSSANATGAANNNNTISNSRIYNFFSAGLSTSGITLSGLNNNWSITGNRIYQEAARNYTTGNLHRGIVANNTLGTFNISNNVIGYASSTATGTYTMAWATVQVPNRFFGMDINCANSPVSTISGNEIASINVATSSTGTGSGAPFCGIWLNAGGANITGNTVGSLTGTDNILVRGTVTGGSATTANVIGIAQGAASASAITISNNNIGGIGFNGVTAAFAPASGIGATIAGIFNQGATTLTDPTAFRTISGNTIGGTVAGSIRAGNANQNVATMSANFSVIGILQVGSTRMSISNNTVQNLSVPTRSSAGVVYGIHTTTGINTISGNTVHTLTSNAKNTGTTTAAHLAGISHTSTTAPVAGTEVNIAQNTIRNLKINSDSSLVIVNGISYTGSTTVGFNYLIQRNNIYDIGDLTLTASDTAKVTYNGIGLYGGIATVQNNMISMGDGNTKSQVYQGILKANANINRVYHNSVYIGGNASTASGVVSGSTWAFRRTSRPTAGNDEIINNIFYNARTTAIGGAFEYAIGLDSNINVTSNKNILFADFANGGRTGLRNATIATSMADWRTLSGQDLNSISENPNFVAPSAGTPDLHLQSPPATVPAEQAGLAIAVTDDFDGQTRSALSPVDIGADAGNYLPSGDYLNPTIYSVTFSPGGGGCTPSAHVVTAVINDASGISSAVINWSLNGVAQTAITMTNVSDSTWTGTIPASGTSTVSFTVTAIDGAVALNASTSAAQSYADAPLAVNFTAGADQTICPGTPATLKMTASAIGRVRISEVLINKGGTGDPNPLPPSWGTLGTTFPDVIEVTNMGANTVDIGGWIIEIRGAGARTYTVPAGVTLDSGQIASFHAGTGTDVPAQRLYNMGGANDGIFSSSASGFIIRNGSEIIDAVAINGYVFTGTPTVSASDWTGTIPSASGRGGVIRIGSTDSNNASDWQLANAPSPIITLNTRNSGITIPASAYTFAWAPGGETTQSITVIPGSAPAQYIGTLSDGVCSYSDTVVVNWLSTLPAPVAYDSSHCGNQQAKCDVGSVPGAIAYRWYTTPTGGTPIQNLPDTNLLQNVAVTTTFYVAAFDGVCDGPRVAVTETVVQPDVVDITSTPNDTICLGNVATLNAVSVNTNYTYVWAGTGVGTLNTNTGSTVISTPTAAGTYSFIVIATDAGAGCVTTDTLNLFVGANPIGNANIDQTTICAGESVQLNVSSTITATIGQNEATSSTTSYPTAYGSYFWGHRQQILILASELSAAGFTAGPINSLAFNVTAAAGQVLNGFSIAVNHTSASDLSTQQTTGTVVFGPVNYTSAVGVNTHTFTTPFVWNGTSNIVVETCFNNGSFTTNSTTIMDNTSFISCRWLNADNATVCGSATGTTANQRPLMILNGTSVPSGVAYSWSPATGLSAANIANPVATPTTSTTYVVSIINSVTGCFTNDTVVINVLPVLPAPTTNSSSHCGNQIPTASINAVPGATAYYWYDAPTAGNIVQADPSLTFLSPIGTTTTLYVSAFDGTCYSPRTPITITVATPPAILASASDSSLCAGTNSINLSETLGNYPTYTWSSTAGGNLNSTSGQNVTASPADPGTYNYIVEGTDGVCTNTDTVIVVVFSLPSVSANINSASVCAGTPVQLDVPTTLTIGQNDAVGTTTSYPSAYGAFYWGYRMQNMILASELTAGGFTAGPINALSYNITTPAGQTLNGYTIKMANVAAADLNAEQTVTAVVYGPVNYNSVVGINTHTFTTPFIWDGVSNVVIETCFNNTGFTTNSVSNMDNTSFVSSRWLNQDAAGVCASATVSTALQRPVMILSRVVPGVTYSWSPATGLSATNIPNPVATPLVSTNYVVTVTDNVTGCTNTDTVVINVTPLPAAPTTNSPITRCGPGDVTATATGSGGTLFWTGPNGGNILSFTGSLTQSVTASGIFDVREFPANLDTTAVGYNPITNPSAPVGYFPTTSQGMWFRVNNPGGTIIQSVDIYPNGPVGTPYGIAIIDSLGNTIGSVSGVTTVTAPNYETVQLNIYVPFSTTPYAMRPTSSPNLSVHQNATVQATAPWQIAGEITILAYGNMPPAASFFGNTTFGMFYNWQVMHGCFGNEAVVNYTVNPAPALAITPSGPTTFCGSGSVTLDAGAAPTDPSYVNFSWSPATGLNTTTGAVVTANVNTTTTYTVTADDGLPNGCVNTATVTLTVNTAPYAEVGIVPDTICATSPFQFNGSGGSASFKYVGTTQNLGQTAGWPFNGANASQRMQVYVSAAELNAAGLFGPSFINSVGFNVVAKLSSQPYSNFTVAIDEVVGGCFSSTTYLTIPGANTVYTGNYSTVAGWNDIVFQTPYAWDGVSDLVIQTCFTNTTNTLFDIVYTTQTAGCNSTNALNAAACGAATGTLSEFRPNMRFQGGSVNYSWSPATELSATNIANPVFTQSLGIGNRQYVLTVTDPVSGCTATDTANFYVNPTPVAPSIEFAGLDTTICISGTVSFSSIFVDGSLQWQISSDNVNFFDVIGQTGSTYTTGILTADSYIRLKAFCTDSSYSNVKYVKVNNPQILSTENDTVCGQGNVSLLATANPGYFIRWYADSTSGNYLANGSPYNTFVTQTDTFWVAALVDTLVGSGGDTLTSTFAGGNGSSGNFFDVNVTSPVTLTGMRINNNTAGAICEVWYRSGTHVGFEGSSAGWTQIYNGPVAAAQGYISGLNLPLSTGVTSFFVFLPGGGITYTNGTTLGGVVSSDANLAILEGYGTGGTFGSGLFGPPTGTRIWNGSLIYSVPNCVSARVPVIAVVNPAPAVVVTPGSATICEGSSVNLDVTTGTGDYTNFDWAPAAGLNTTSGISVVASPSVTTSYVVTATGNINGCQNSDTVVVTVNPAPVFSIATTTPNICGGDTAKASVTITSPIPSNYNLNSIPFSPVAPSGPVTVLVDAGVAVVPQTIASLDDGTWEGISLPAGFAFSYYGVPQTQFNVSTNGFITLGASLGTAACCSGQLMPNAATPNNLLALAHEDYLLSASGTIDYFTTGTAPFRKFVVRFTNVPRFGGTGAPTTGQIVLNETLNTIEYHVTSVTTAAGDATTMGIENATGTQATVVPGRNSTSPWNATNEGWQFQLPAAATVQWSGANIIGSTTGTSINALPTTSGYYTVVVTNPLTGCTKADSVLINAGINPQPVIVTNDTTLCAPNEIYVKVADAGPYSGGYPAGTTFAWYDATGGIIVPATPDLDSISSTNASSFYVVVTLPSFCDAISDTAYVVTKAVSVVPTINNATCSAGGSILATVTSGIAPFQYVWSTDPAQTNVIQTTTTASTTDLLSNLAAGTYYLSVSDEFGQPGSCNSGVIPFVVGGASQIVISVDAQTNVSCNGQADGAVTISYTGGVSPYTVLWSNGQTTTSLAGLSAGTYTVTVSDLSGCADTLAVIITEPTALSATLSSTQESAPGASDGSVTALVSGGTTPYVIDWFDLIPNPVGSGATVTGLTGGFYQVLIVDSNNCQLIDTVEVTTVSNATLNLTVLIQGFHDGAGGLVPNLFNAGIGASFTESDSIRVELRDALSPTTVLGSETVVLSTTGTTTITYPSSVLGNNCYIAVFHRNSVETWSGAPITVGSSNTYDFTTAATQAFGSNQVELLPGVWAMYSGDIDDGSFSFTQDGFIDIFDFLPLDGDIQLGNFGYVNTDLDGTGFVDAFDFLILDPNIQLGVSKVTP